MSADLYSDNIVQTSDHSTLLLTSKMQRNIVDQMKDCNLLCIISTEFNVDFLFQDIVCANRGSIRPIGVQRVVRERQRAI